MPFGGKEDAALSSINRQLNGKLVERALATFGAVEIDQSLAADEPDQGKVASSLFRAYVNDRAPNKDMSSYFLDEVCATQGQLMRLFPIVRTEAEAEKKYKVQFKGSTVIFEAHRNTMGVMGRVAERGSLRQIPEQYHVWRHELERRGAFFELPIHFMVSDDLRARCDLGIKSLVRMSVLTAEAVYQETLFYQARIQHANQFMDQTYTAQRFSELLQSAMNTTGALIKNGTSHFDLSAQVFKYFSRNGTIAPDVPLKMVALVTSTGATSLLFRREDLRRNNLKEEHPKLPNMWTNGFSVGPFGEDWRATIEFNNMDGKPLQDPSVRQFAGTQRFQSRPTTLDGAGNWGAYKTAQRTIVVPDGATAMNCHITAGDCFKRSGFSEHEYLRHGVLKHLHNIDKYPVEEEKKPTIRDLMIKTKCYDELRPAFLASTVAPPDPALTRPEFEAKMAEMKVGYFAGDAASHFLHFNAGELWINVTTKPPHAVSAGGLSGVVWNGTNDLAPAAGDRTGQYFNNMRGKYSQLLRVARTIKERQNHFAIKGSNATLDEINPAAGDLSGDAWLEMKSDDVNFWRKCLENNLPFPLSFDHHRTVVMDMGSALYLIPGDDTAFGIPRYAGIFLTEEIETNMARFSAHFQFGLVVVKHTNLFLYPDVVPVCIKGGTGTEPFDMSEYNVDAYKQSSTAWLDKMVTFVTAYNEPFRFFTNLTGTMNEAYYSAEDSRKHYTTADFYKERFGFRNDNDFPYARLPDEDPVDINPRTRMVSVQAHCLRYNSATDRIDDPVAGFDFMGECAGPSEYRKWRKGAQIDGSTTSVTEPH